MPQTTSSTGSPLTVRGPSVPREDEILTPEALAFVAELQREFGARRDELLARRRERRDEIARTHRLDFLPGTQAIRDGSWQVAPAPPDLVDRRVEITGPTEPKMAINALNSGAKVWLADLEDANTPHWENVVGGQLTLHDAVRRRLSFTSPEGREYRLRQDGALAVLVVRPRGWHFDEDHLLLDGGPVVAALADFGLHFFHNAAELLPRGSGPYFYLPKTESHLEARLWNDVFSHAEQRLGIPHGSVRATVLIETITAAFEMDEILYELREHASGLNAGRWDYLFSMIKNFRDAGLGLRAPGPRCGDDDRATHACVHRAPRLHLPPPRRVRHGRHGGLHPEPARPEVNERALAKVREDKEREAADGFDGSWVAHPDLVAGLRGGVRPRPGRPARTSSIASATTSTSPRPTLLDMSAVEGRATEAGLRNNVDVGLRYLRGVVARQRRGGHPQPHGGRGDGGDLPIADLAVGAQRRPAGHGRPRDA